VANPLSLNFGRFFFRYRDALAPVALLITMTLTQPLAPFGAELWDACFDAMGILIAFCGQLVRVTVIGLAYIKRGGRNKQITADRLVCEGVFAHSRNPMYLGNFLIVTGLLIVWNSPWAYALVLPVIGGALLSITRAEESFLHGKFGEEYAAYCAHVPRFVPDPRGFRETLRKFEFDWKRVIRKEYGTTFAWTSVALVLIVGEKVSRRGLAAARGPSVALVLVWSTLLSLWIVARWMKKTHRLDSSD
jgi:protein-S-isoprenylcysteine O-methyltransferase Ste14